MKLSRISIITALGAALTAFVGCTQKEIEESRAILPEEYKITLSAVESATPVTIYADGTWMADVTEDWMSIEPSTGKGTMQVTLTVTENTGTVAREGQIVIKGSSLIEDVVVDVYQKYDRFRNTSPCSISEALALPDSSLVKLSESQVMVLTTNGFVVNDGTANVFVEGSTGSLKVGDKVTLTGDLVKINGINGIKLDESQFKSAGEATYPEPKDVTEEASYAPGKVEFVKVSASYTSGGKLSINGKQVAVVYKPVDDLSALNKHEVTLTGYYVGITSKVAALAVVSYEDNGETPILGKALPFKDNFDWVAPFVQYDKDNGRTTGDSMGDKKTVGYGNAYAIPGFEDKFTGEMGYESMFYSSKTVYVCGGNYLKFSKTNNCNGVRLPAFAIDGTTDLRLSFDWGKNGSDKVDLVVEIEGNGTINGNKTSEELSVAEGFTWKSETVTINGADAGTRICIRPTAYTGAVHTDGSLYRWFLDNVEVVSLAGMVEAEIQIGGLESEVITFEGLAPKDVTFTVNSNADYSILTNASWLHLDVAEGVANEEQTVTVKCDESQLSTLRQSEIVVKSGLTTMQIPVVQSAAGQALKPFISIVGGNSLSFKGAASEQTVSVQANVPYEISVASGSDWLTATKVETKAAVEFSDVIISASENKGAERVGIIAFSNPDENLVAYLTVIQAESTVTLAKWFLDGSTMDSYKVHFTSKDKVAGDGGQYIDANDGGSGKISYVQVDKTDLDVDGKAERVTGGTGEPYVIGAWVGDYWLITANYEKGIPAGATIHGFFVSRASGSGLKYWLAEYLDGTEWKPLMETSTVKSGDAEVVYNINHNNTANFPVDFTYKVGTATKEVKIRITAVALDQANGKGPITKPNGGTVRIKGNDGLSPYIEMTM